MQSSKSRIPILLVLALALSAVTTFNTVFAVSVAMADDAQSPTRACPKPNPKTANWPGLNFTMAAWGPSDLKTCKEKVRLAREMGFTGITLAPRFNFDPTTGGITAIKGSSEMIDSCLKEIWSAGMDLNYKPHLEDEKCWIEKKNILNACWRAWLNVYPQLDYPKSAPHRTMYEPFLKWAEKNKRQIRQSNGHQKLRLVLATELEKSLTWHPQEWANVIQNLKHELNQRAGLDSKNIQVGINPNWLPFCTMSHQNCSQLETLLRTTDFINPSIYGDRSNDSKERLSKKSLEERRDSLIDLQLKRGGCGFSGKKKNELFSLVREKIGVGEVGVGPSFDSSEDWDGRVSAFETEISEGNYSSIDDYKFRRKRMVENLIELLKLSSSPDKSLSFWSSGIHDFTGISSRRQTVDGITTENTIPQEGIVALLQKYSETRCGMKYLKSPAALIAEARKLNRTDQLVTLEDLIRLRTQANLASGADACEPQNPVERFVANEKKNLISTYKKVRNTVGPYLGMAVYCSDDVKESLFRKRSERR